MTEEQAQSPAEILSTWVQEDEAMDIPRDWWHEVPKVREVAAPVDSFAVGIHQLYITPHPNADALELAVVGGISAPAVRNAPGCEDGCGEVHEEIIGGFRAVVPKGQYRTGDYAVYIPEAAMLPDALIEELGLTGKLAGSGKNRVKAIRLRGELSQGIVCRPEIMQTILHNMAEYQPAPADAVELGEYTPDDWYQQEVLATNFANTLGIIKYSPRVPAAFAGKIRERGNSEILGWVDIPNIKKDMRMFSEGEQVVATEKVHGTCCLITLDVKSGTLMVSSKGMAKQGWDLLEEEGNVYWRAVRAARLEELLRWISENVAVDVDRIGLYGEVFGAGIQDLDYGFRPDEGPQFIAFDLRYDDMWVNHQQRIDVLGAAQRATQIFIHEVPVLYTGPYDYERLCELAEGHPETRDPDTGEPRGGSYVGGRHVMEGLVVRPVVERRSRSGGRALAKFINPDYLTRKGLTTEFE